MLFWISIIINQSNTTDSNIHSYRFGDPDEIKTIIKYDGMDVTLEFTVVPEFPLYNLVYLATFTILLTLLLSIRKGLIR